MLFSESKESRGPLAVSAEEFDMKRMDIGGSVTSIVQYHDYCAIDFYGRSWVPKRDGSSTDFFSELMTDCMCFLYLFCSDGVNVVLWLSKQYCTIHLGWYCACESAISSALSDALTPLAFQEEEKAFKERVTLMTKESQIIGLISIWSLLKICLSC